MSCRRFTPERAASSGAHRSAWSRISGPPTSSGRMWESLADRIFYRSSIQNLFHAEVIAVRDQRTDLPAFFFVKIGRSHKAPDEIGVPDADLEFIQPGFLKSVHNMAIISASASTESSPISSAPSWVFSFRRP